MKAVSVVRKHKHIVQRIPGAVCFRYQLEAGGTSFLSRPRLHDDGPLRRTLTWDEYGDLIVANRFIVAAAVLCSGLTVSQQLHQTDELWQSCSCFVDSIVTKDCT